MAIESDQLVFDYLSRVGDLAQQHQLPSGTRMRLVTELRREIDRRRGSASGDSPGEVRRILAGIGTPEEAVDRVAGGASAEAVVPAPRAEEPKVKPRLRGMSLPRPRRGKDSAGVAASSESAADTADTGESAPATAASPPHLAGEDELGPSGAGGVDP
ncbi:hypothetical protein U9R90_36295, partial [Streptomyces sp. E11-3]